MQQQLDEEAKLVDARNDERWAKVMESLSLRQDHLGMWRFARTAPPVWTVRAVKFLHKQGWKPTGDDQPDLFQTIHEHSAACNEFDLPGPERRSPTSLEWGQRLSTARITLDGEFIFLIDRKASAVDVVTGDSLIPVEHVRLDVWRGNQCAPLAIAITPSGNRLACLLFDCNVRAMFVRLWILQEGEVQAEHHIELESLSFGREVPLLEFSPDGKRFAIVDDNALISIFDSYFFRRLYQFQNPGSLFGAAPIILAKDSPSSSWRRFGQRCLSDNISRNLRLFHNDEKLIVRTEPGMNCWNLSQVQPQCNMIRGELSSSALPLENFQYAMGCINETIPLWEYVFIGLAEDGDLAATAMPQRGAVIVNHLPDARPLGTLYGLKREPLVDLQVTSGGTIVAVLQSGCVTTWTADGNGNAWPWSKELVRITHQPVDESSVELMRQAEEMRRRGWLSIQETKLLDLALALLLNRLGLDIEIDWEDTRLPCDMTDIELADGDPCDD